MRLAVLGDIHGNLPALEAVCEDIIAEGVDQVIVCGDVLAGPLPRETLTLLQEWPKPVRFVRGNHDSDVVRFLSGKHPGGMVESDNAAAQWVAGKISLEQQAFLMTWDLTLKAELKPWGKALFCHATPCSDTFIFSCETPEAVLIPILGHRDVDLIVCAHTHMQFDRMIADIRVVNTGSVGMCVGRTGADWLLIDDDIHFMHTDYDLDAAAARIRSSDYPDAEAFAARRVLKAGTRKQMFEIIDRREALQTLADD